VSNAVFVDAAEIPVRVDHGDRRGEWVANTSPTLCTGFVPGTPASVPPYPVLQHTPTHHFAWTESGCTALVPPYAVLQRAPSHHFARTESRRTTLVPPYAVLQHAPTHRCARTESGRTALKLLQARLAMNKIFEVLGENKNISYRARGRRARARGPCNMARQLEAT
jgi:hypothetical protein